MNLTHVKYSALCLTHNCNLRCEYCYAGDKTDTSMRPDTARRAIDFLAAAAGGPCVVTFFGGEPLLELDLLKETVAYSRKRHQDKIQFRMSTNGTLLQQSTIDYCAENDIFFALSLDGDREQHNSCRSFAGGTGSYDTIVKNLPRILEANPYTIAVSVVVPETAGRVAAGVRDLFRQGFRYVLQSLDYTADWGTRDFEILKNQYIKLADYYFDALRDGKKIYYGPFDERIKTHAQKPYRAGELCDLANSQIAIAASGRIYPCVQFVGNDGPEDQAGVIGNVTEGFDEIPRRYFIGQNYEDKKECAGCALEGRCSNYCGCVNWRATGNIKTPSAVVCGHERMLMPVIDKLANKLWKQNVSLFRRKFYDKSFAVSSYIEDCSLNRKG